MNAAPFVIERTVNAPVAKVWKAITDKDDMKQWYFDLSEFRAEVGFEFEFYGGTPEKQFLHKCKIIEVLPLKKLTYSWRYEGYEGISFVTFELFEEQNKTRIKLTHAGLETFSPISELVRENFVAGWTDIIGRSIVEFVEKP